MAPPKTIPTPARSAPADETRAFTPRTPEEMRLRQDPERRNECRLAREGTVAVGEVDDASDVERLQAVRRKRRTKIGAAASRAFVERAGARIHTRDLDVAFGDRDVRLLTEQN